MAEVDYRYLPVFERILLDIVTPGQPDAETDDAYFFIGLPKDFCYYPFCQDFGPLNLLCMYKFCTTVRDVLQEFSTKQIVVWSDDELSLTNAVFLIGAYLVIFIDKSPCEVETMFEIVKEKVHFYRDVSPGEPNFALHLRDCWDAIAKAKEIGWIDFDLESSLFDADEYDHYGSPLNSDLHVVVPDKFIAMVGPISLSCGSEWRDTAEGYRQFSPKYMLGILQDFDAQAVVRLNEPQYDADILQAGGVTVVDLFFEDCAAPPPDVLVKFMAIAEHIPGLIAVHCKAGLGRTGTLIALYLMQHHGFTAREAIAWLRIVRPGCVIGDQQEYLCQHATLPRAITDLIREAVRQCNPLPPGTPVDQVQQSIQSTFKFIDRRIAVLLGWQMQPSLLLPTTTAGDMPDSPHAITGLNLADHSVARSQSSVAPDDDRVSPWHLAAGEGFVKASSAGTCASGEWSNSSSPVLSHFVAGEAVAALCAAAGNEPSSLPPPPLAQGCHAATDGLPAAVSAAVEDGRAVFDQSAFDPSVWGQCYRVTEDMFLRLDLVGPDEPAECGPAAAEAGWEVISMSRAEFKYCPVAGDFGPLSLLCVYRFCQCIDVILSRAGRRRAVVCAASAAAVTNGALLIGAYLILRRGETPSAVGQRFAAAAGHLLSYPDASRAADGGGADGGGGSDVAKGVGGLGGGGGEGFMLRLEDCWGGLARARDLGWVDFGPGPDGFDPEEYEHFSSPLNADLHVLVPDRMILLPAPLALPGGAEWRDVPGGSRQFSPAYVREVLAEFDVQALVRLSRPLCDARELSAGGLPTVDLYAEDCVAPPPEVVLKFMAVVERLAGPVAVACRTGLSRAGTLAALYLMKHGGFSAREAMAWVRIVRPGSIVGAQQDFLIRQDKYMPRAREAYRRSAAAAAASSTPPAAAAGPAPTTPTDAPPSTSEVSMGAVGAAAEPVVPRGAPPAQVQAAIAAELAAADRRMAAAREAAAAAIALRRGGGGGGGKVRALAGDRSGAGTAGARAGLGSAGGSPRGGGGGVARGRAAEVTEGTDGRAGRGSSSAQVSPRGGGDGRRSPLQQGPQHSPLGAAGGGRAKGVLVRWDSECALRGVALLKPCNLNSPAAAALAPPAATSPPAASLPPSAECSTAADSAGAGAPVSGPAGGVSFGDSDLCCGAGGSGGHVTHVCASGGNADGRAGQWHGGGKDGLRRPRRNSIGTVGPAVGVKAAAAGGGAETALSSVRETEAEAGPTAGGGGGGRLVRSVSEKSLIAATGGGGGAGGRSGAAALAEHVAAAAGRRNAALALQHVAALERVRS